MGCPSTLSPLWMMLPFACSTAADLQRMFDTVTVFGGRMGFQLNVRQSGVVICGPLRRRQQIIEGSFVWRMAADTVPVVTSCKHLGVAGCARSATRSRDQGSGKRQVTASLAALAVVQSHMTTRESPSHFEHRLCLKPRCCCCAWRRCPARPVCSISFLCFCFLAFAGWGFRSDLPR